MYFFVERMEQLSDLHKILQNKGKNELQFICLDRVDKNELVRIYIMEYNEKNYNNRVIQINLKSYSYEKEILMNFFYNLAYDILGIINANNKEKKLCSIIENVYKYLLRTGLVKLLDKLIFTFYNLSIQQSDNL